MIKTDINVGYADPAVADLKAGDISENENDAGGAVLYSLESPADGSSAGFFPENSTVDEDATGAATVDTTDGGGGTNDSPPPDDAFTNDAAGAAQPSIADSGEPVCTLYVRCDTILSNIEKLNPEKAGLVPGDGVIFYSGNVLINEGDSVFDILQREMRQAKIHFEFSGAAALNSLYIKGINNIYEFDCGELSGWTYRVNGAVPGYGCSVYGVARGDVVEILYTCDLGLDVGGEIVE